MNTAAFLKQSCIAHLLENKKRIFQCLSLLDEESIWLHQNTNLSSIGNLVIHLNGNIRQYIISSLGGEKDLRKRNSEFSSELRLSMQDLISSHESTIDQSIAVIQQLPEEELLRIRKVQGFEMNGVDILVHVTEHYSYHTGQIAFITKSVKDIDLGFYKDLDLNITNEENEN